MTEEAPDKRRGTLWFDCCYCEKTWHKETYNSIRRAAARHMNEEHGRELARSYDRVELETRDGFQVDGNKYMMTRVEIYITPFDILQPAIGGGPGLVNPADVDNICQRCGQRVPHDGDVEQVEDNPDEFLDDEWTCSTCIDEKEVTAKQTANRSIYEFA